jgi:cellulose biosynthesis protein BcsQ
VKILAAYNIKGGVGKTATAVNLAYLSARAGYRTLVWDLDPQGAATFYFRIKPKMRGAGKALIRGKRHPDSLIRETDYPGLDLLRAQFSYRHLDLTLAESRRPDRRLAKVLALLEDEYDRVYLDCAPGITLAAQSVFYASHALLLPTIPTTLSLRTLDQLLRYLQREGPKRTRVLPFYSMVDARKSLQRRICEATAGNARFLSSRIPYASLVEQMGERRAPLPAFAPTSAPARAFEHLWREVETRLATSLPINAATGGPEASEASNPDHRRLHEPQGEKNGSSPVR